MARTSAAVSWRWLGLLFVTSGALGLATLGFELGRDVNRLGVLIVALAAIGGGFAAIALANWFPSWMLLVGLVNCICLVSTAVGLSGGAQSPYLLLFAWSAVEAWYFLPSRTATWYTAFAGVVVGFTLYVSSDPGAGVVAAWLMVMGTMAAIGALTGTLRARSDALIDMLEDRATRDELTGLPNRRGYHERIEQELARATRHDLPLSIVLADIDDFKSLNDRFGHRYGDRALRDFAELCSNELRGADLVCRVGGEEFAIVLPHVAEHDALVTAERLRRAVRDGLGDPDGRPLTASFGVASFPRHGSDPEILLDHADQAMYAAKHLGRDRTVVFSDGLLASLRDDTDTPAEQLQAVLVMAETLDLRDSGTATHSQTVGRVCAGIAEGMGLGAARVERIRLAGILHDVGKLGVSDEILRKPGALTAEEWTEMRKHSELGARMVAAAGMDDISSWVLAHHERPDGTGYPNGTAGDDIPIEARILAVGDAYEAMTADRPYRKAPGHEFALEQLEAGSGAQFDAAVVAAFCEYVARQAAVPAFR
jgi:diguanylate cyclase (GGDEF)-like protein/putative nucleotidyltransferase with HDIG domain